MHEAERQTGYRKVYVLGAWVEPGKCVGTYLLRGARWFGRGRERNGGCRCRSGGSLRGSSDGSSNRNCRPSIPFTVVKLVLGTGEETNEDGAEEQEDESRNEQDLRQR